jgi:hypothetical protein
VAAREQHLVAGQVGEGRWPGWERLPGGLMLDWGMPFSSPPGSYGF